MQKFLILAKQGLNSPSRLFKTEFFTFLYTFPGSIPLVVYVLTTGVKFKDITNSSNHGIASGLVLVLLFFPFVTALGGLFRQVRIQHGRHWKTLITPLEKIDWKKFALGAGVWGGITASGVLLSIALSPRDYTLAFDPISFFSLMIGACLIIPLQASFEEIATRGYLMQQIALVSKRVWQPLLLSSITFALLHGANPEVEAYGFASAMPWYLIFGVIVGIATIMDNGLELAMGAHTANNIVAALLVTDKNSVFQTSALFVNNNPTISFYDNLLLIGGGAIFLVVFARKYKWGSLSLLWSKIERPVLIETNDNLTHELNTL